MQRIEKVVLLSWVKAHPLNARTHSKRQIDALARAMKIAITAPIILDGNGFLIAGHARVEAARKLGLTEFPAVIVAGLSDAQLRALMLADNKLAELAGWDRGKLAVELPQLAALLIEDDLDITVTGYSIPEIEMIGDDFRDAVPPAEELDPKLLRKTPVSQLGDLYRLRDHRLACGSALDSASIEALMQGQKAAAAFLDPPIQP
jgi:ParB-like nuclease domain